MKLVVISPEQDRADEVELVRQMFAAGLERFHLRKPHSTPGDIERWVAAIPADWRLRIVLHQHHHLVERLGLGGRHWRDTAAADSPDLLGRGSSRTGGSAPTTVLSRSCHDLACMRRSLGAYDSIFFGPVFPSISKPGYEPNTSQTGEALGAVLNTRSDAERRTAVIALGGITAETARRTIALGFDGVAVVGAVWHAADPVRAFREVADVCRRAAMLKNALVGRRLRSSSSSISGARC